MTEQWHRVFREWAKTEQFQQALQSANTAIADALARAEKPYISFSGGKDSSVMMHLVIQQNPNVMVLHWDYGRHFVPLPIYRQILANARAIGACNLRVETSPLYAKLGRQARNILGRHMLGRLVPQLRAEGYDLAFIGLRAEESIRRRRRIAEKQALTAIPECFPLAQWRWLDVWAYIVTRHLPYLSIYDQVAELIGYDQARFTTFFDPEFYDLGTESVDNVLWWRWRNL